MRDSAQISYTDVRNSWGEITPRPILAVDIIHEDASVRVAGLLDSGADVNVLPYRLGLELGLVWGVQRYDLRLSGNLANYDTRVVVLPVKIADFVPVDLAFIWTQSEQAPLIFGQNNFFQSLFEKSVKIILLSTKSAIGCKRLFFAQHHGS